MGISLGEFIRRSMQRALHTEPEDDPLFADEIVFDGAVPSDLSENHDRYLYDSDT
jgi:hypothetical protein